VSIHRRNTDYITSNISLGLRAAKIEFEGNEILVDEHYRTNDPDIYAFGSFVKIRKTPNYQYRFVSERELARKVRKAYTPKYLKYILIISLWLIDFTLLGNRYPEKFWRSILRASALPGNSANALFHHKSNHATQISPIALECHGKLQYDHLQELYLLPCRIIHAYDGGWDRCGDEIGEVSCFDKLYYCITHLFYPLGVPLGLPAALLWQARKTAEQSQVAL